MAPMHAQQLTRDTGRRYPAAVAEFARQLYASGAQLAEVRAALARRGYRPAKNTVILWCNGEAREAANVARRGFPGAQKGKIRSAETRLRRMRKLREIGLTDAAIAAVMNHDFSTSLTKESVRYLLTDRVGTRAIRRHLEPMA